MMLIHGGELGVWHFLCVDMLSTRKNTDKNNMDDMGRIATKK